MRGSPLLRAALAFVVILLLGWPLRELTGAARPEAAVAVATAPVPARPLALQLTFTTKPKSVRILHLGNEVLSDAAPEVEIERALQIPYPKEGVDLQFEIDFPEGATLAAMRVRLTDPEGETHEKSLWGTGRIDDVLTFP